MVTPLAPWISVMTPWAETEAARAARVHEYFILIDVVVGSSQKK